MRIQPPNTLELVLNFFSHIHHILYKAYLKKVIIKVKRKNVKVLFII